MFCVINYAKITIKYDQVGIDFFNAFCNTTKSNRSRTNWHLLKFLVIRKCVLDLLKGGENVLSKTAKIGFFHKPKTCLGMCDITLKLALIQSLVVLLKIYKIKKLGKVASAVISPILPKRCEQICIFKLHEHFICSGGSRPTQQYRKS